MTSMTPRAIGAAALAAAAGIHLAVAPEHLREAESHGVFFLLIAVAQGVWAIQVMRGAGSRLLRLIGVVNLAVIGIWTMSRTVGLPGEASEPVGVADLSTTLLEAIAVGSVVALLGARPRLGRVAWAPATALLGVSLFAGGAVGAFPASLDNHHTAPAAHAVSKHDRAPADSHLHGISDGRIDPGPLQGPRVDAPAIKVGELPTAIAEGFGKLWITDRQLGTLTEMEPATGATRSVPVGKGPSGVATGHGAVWVTDFSRDELVRVDPKTLAMTRTPIGSGPTAVVSGPGGIWVASISRGIAQLVDARTLQILATIPVGYGPTGIAADAEAIWVANTLDRTVVRIDPRTRRLVGDPIDVGAGAVGITTGFGRVWVAGASAGTVDVIDPSTNTVRRLTVDDVSLPGQGPIAVTAGPRKIWVANNHDKTILSIDPATYAVGPPTVFAAELGSHPIAVQLAYEGNSLWITNYQDGTVRRVQVLA